MYPVPVICTDSIISGKHTGHSERSTWSMQCHGACKQALRKRGLFVCFSLSISLFSFMCFKLEVEKSSLDRPKDRLCVYACTEHAQSLGLSYLLFSISVNQKCLHGEFQVIFKPLSTSDIYSTFLQENCYWIGEKLKQCYYYEFAQKVQPGDHITETGVLTELTFLFFLHRKKKGTYNNTGISKLR